MADPRDQSEFLWEKGWNGHEKAQFLRMARLSFAEKVRWLEDTQELIQNMELQKVSSPDLDDHHSQ